MFRTLITRPVDPLTDLYIQKLQRPESEPDLTLTMLGLAVFKKRMPEYNGIVGINTDSSNLTRLVEHFNSLNEKDISFNYYYTLDNEFDFSDLSGFKHKDTVEKCLQSRFPAYSPKVLYSTEKNCAVLVSSGFSSELYHLALSFLPLYYPRIFTSPITKEDPDLPLFASLSQNTSDVFKAEVTKALSAFKEEFLVCQIEGLIKAMHETKIQSAKNEMISADRNLERALDVYTEAVQSCREARVKYEGTLQVEKTTEEEEELVQYLCTCPKIKHVSVVGDVIGFIVETTLHQFDLDAWESFDQNGSVYESNNYPSSGVFASKENKRLLCNAIFSEDPKFEIKMCGLYNIHLAENRVRTRSEYPYETLDSKYAAYIPNPHLQNFACLGDYTYRVARALTDRDLIRALELCVHSAGCVNLDETEQNFKPLLSWIFRSTEKVLRRFDGVEMTPGEALIWLLDEKEKENETN